MPSVKTSTTDSKRAQGQSASSQQQQMQHSSKKLTAEEVAKSAQRLATSRRPEVQLKPLVESQKLTKVDEEKSVKRLYDEAVASQKRRLEELQKRHDETLSPKTASGLRTLAQSEEQEAISRLYEKSLQHKQLVQAELEKKFTHDPATKHLDAAAQEDVNKRLYGESISKHREGRAKLFEKYVVDHEPKVAKRTNEELRASATRLSAGDK